MSDGAALKAAIDALAPGEVGCYDIASNTITAPSSGSNAWITIPSGASVKIISSTNDGVISGGGAVGMFNVNSGRTLELEGLTLSDAYADGHQVSQPAPRIAACLS